jgi:hypothetical protein
LERTQPKNHQEIEFYVRFGREAFLRQRTDDTSGILARRTCSTDALSNLQNFYDTFTSGRPCVASQLLGDSEMNIPASRNNGHLLYWMAAALLLIVFGLGDTAIVAWWASLLTFGQLVAVSLALVLTATGAFLTVWQMRRQAGR